MLKISRFLIFFTFAILHLAQLQANTFFEAKDHCSDAALLFPSLTVTNIVPESCPGAADGSFTIIATNGSGTYLFSKDGNSFVDGNGTAPNIHIFTGLTAGFYNAKVYDLNSGDITNPTVVQIIVSDTEPPVVRTKPFDLYFSGAGGDLNPADIDAGTTDNCGSVTLFASPNGFSCFASGQTFTVRLIAKDQSGNLAESTTLVRVFEIGAPNLTCPSPQTLTLAANCEAVLPDYTILANAFDYCGNLDGFTPPPISQNLAPGTIISDTGDLSLTLSSSDLNGNTAQCEMTVSVERPNTFPQLTITNVTPETCPGAADGSITAIASPSCGTFDFSKDGGSSFVPGNGSNSYTFANLTAGQYFIKVRDGNNNITNAEVAVVESADTEPPVVRTKNFDLYFSEGSGRLLPSDVDAGTSDNCGIRNLSVSPNIFTCYVSGQTIAVTLIAYDHSGNRSEGTAYVSVFETGAPDITCPSGQVLNLNADCEQALPDYRGLAEAYDNCGQYNGSQLPTLTQSPAPGTIIPGGQDVTVTLTATDYPGNSSNCQFNVSVEDMAPEALCKNATVQLDATGIGSLTISAIDNGSTDDCGIAGTSLDRNSFNCDDAGTLQTVTLTVSDNNGHSSSCEAKVSVLDNIAPSLQCPLNVSVNTDPGECGAYVSLPKAAPTDNCGIQSLSSRYRRTDAGGNPMGNWADWAGDPSGFFEVGFYEVQWRAVDKSDLEGFCSFYLAVTDQEAPDMVCKNTSVNFNGEASLALPLAAIYDETASFDACGAVTVTHQSRAELRCEELGTTVSVQVSGLDANGNPSSCTAQVSVTGMPCGFTATNVGCPDGASASYDPSQEVFTITADDCSGYPEGEYSLVGTESCGDTEITVRVADIAGDGRAGIVVMENPYPGARMVAIIKDHTRTVRTEYRSHTNGNIYKKHRNRSNVKWLRIVRSDNKFKTYTSTNGRYWKHAHTINFSNFGDCVFAGMVAYSKDPSEAVTASFDQLEINSDEHSSLATVPAGPTAIEELSYQLSPNPSSGYLRVSLPNLQQVEATKELLIYNSTGQLVYRERLPAEQEGAYELDLSALGAGIYYTQLSVNGEYRATKKLVIHK